MLRPPLAPKELAGFRGGRTSCLARHARDEHLPLASTMWAGAAASEKVSQRGAKPG